jgi:hypothetical protein
MFVAVIATDWARLFYFTITIDACARSGALYACDAIGAAQSPYTTLRDAALAEAPSLLPATTTVTAAATTDAAGNAATAVTVAVPFTTITNFPGVPSSQTLTRTVQMRIEPLTTR